MELPGQHRGQRRLEKVDQGDHAGGELLHGEEVAAEADPRHPHGHIQNVGQVFQGVPRQDGDAGELLQTGGRHPLGHRRDMGKQDQPQNDQAAEQEAEAGDHRAAVLCHPPLAQHAVQGEQQGGQQGQPHPEGVQRMT